MFTSATNEAKGKATTYLRSFEWNFGGWQSLKHHSKMSLILQPVLWLLLAVSFTHCGSQQVSLVWSQNRLFFTAKIVEPPLHNFKPFSSYSLAWNGVSSAVCLHFLDARVASAVCLRFWKIKILATLSTKTEPIWGFLPLLLWLFVYFNRAYGSHQLIVYFFRKCSGA